MDARTLEWVPLDDGAAMPRLAFGPPDGPTVLVLPGLSDGCAPISEIGVRSDVPAPPRPLRHHRVVLVSYRHPMPPEVSTADLARDVAGLLERTTDGGPVAVSGHSMGGMVAQHLAAARPDLVGRLVLSATSAAAGASLGSRLERWDRLLVQGRHREFLRDAVDVSYTGAELRARRLLVRFTSPPELGPHVARHLALSAACRSHDARGDLAAVRAPVLVLGGMHDPLVPIDAVRDLADRLPAARLVELDGLAHGIPEQGRRRYVRELARFLGEADRQRAS